MVTSKSMWLPQQLFINCSLCLIMHKNLILMPSAKMKIFTLWRTPPTVWPHHQCTYKTSERFTMELLYNGSGVAKLGHTGAHAQATRGRAPPVQALLKIFGAECTVINCELGTKSAQRCWNRAAQYCYLYLQNNEVSYALLISMYACLL